MADYFWLTSEAWEIKQKIICFKNTTDEKKPTEWIKSINASKWAKVRFLSLSLYIFLTWMNTPVPK